MGVTRCQFNFVLVLPCLVIALAAGACNSASAERVTPEIVLKNRAYSGAPPVITHEVEKLGRGECLTCHLNGDTKDKKGRIAQKTPHPELTRCEQCHLEENRAEVFVKNSFAGKAYKTGIRSQPNGPWLIPHPITMRENCLACHGTDAANRSLVTSHPERQRCVQCHIPAFEGFPQRRPDLNAQSYLEGDWPIWSL